MPHQIGFVESGGGKLAHQNLLIAVRDFVSANGWTVKRYDASGTNHELLLMAPGMSGTEQIFVGLRTYQDAGADLYNLLVGGFTGYVSSNTFDTQPGAFLSGVPAHNNRIDYWLTINGQRLVLAMKVGTPVYETIYLGKFLPYATPGQYPYPLLVSGMLTGAAATRFSETLHSFGFKGAWPSGNQRPNVALRRVDGSWVQPWCWPWYAAGGSEGWLASSTFALRDTNGQYPLLPIVLHDNSSTTAWPATQGNVWGELDGVCFVSGFDNGVENTLSIGGVDWVVVQDVWRTGHIDYIAMRLDS
ncbi:MAG: hypothetical protein LCI02_04835 [Proteobacteria bacterium]|nr:hypothetical protein [Pseudomonadota bacterium]